MSDLPNHNVENFIALLEAIGRRFDRINIADVAGGFHFGTVLEGNALPYVVYKHLGTVVRGRSKSGTNLGTEYLTTTIVYAAYSTTAMAAMRLAAQASGRMKYSDLSADGVEVQQVKLGNVIHIEEEKELHRGEVTHEIEWSQVINVNPED
jgi:hypothetical protein